MMRSIIALIGVGGAIALFFLYTKPAYDEVQSLQNVNKSYDAALEKAAELQRLKQSLLTRYNAFNPVDIERLNKMLPDHVDNVHLVLELDSLASSHGIALQDYTFNYPQAGATANGRPTIGPAREGFDTVTVKFTTATTYPRFIAFLTDLQDSLRVSDIVGISFDSTAPEAGQSSAEPLYRFDITLKTYWLK